MTTSMKHHLCLSAALLGLYSTNGFVQNGANFHRPRLVAYRPNPLLALVFGPDGEKMDDWEEVEEELHSLEGTGISLGMSEKLTQEQIASLARMASAFAPPGQDIDIEHINDIQVLSVDGDRIEISAIVCETDGCITARVPISFPTPCLMSEGIDTCVTNNLAHLDQQAEGLIREMTIKKENKDDDEYVWKMLTSTEELDLPTWWESRPEMTQDCNNIRSLLNEEGFQAELRGVATKALMDIVDHTEQFKVQKAAIAAVCPSGIHMRALVKTTTFLGDEEFKFLQVPLAFKQPALDGDKLRNEVLSAVDAASVYVE